MGKGNHCFSEISQDEGILQMIICLVNYKFFD